MKLSAEQENAVRDVARRCIREIREALKQKPKPSWNTAVPPILKKYHELVKPMGVTLVKPMGVTLVKFNSEIGRLNGRYGVES